MNDRNAPIEVDVAVVGAGIGGTAAAAALSRIGITAHVFEQATQARDGGGSIAIDMRTLAVLKEWGLDEHFWTHGTELRGLENWTGQGEYVNFFVLPDLGAMGVKVDDRDNARRDIYSCLRTDLVGTFATLVPDDQIHRGKKLVAVEDKGTHVEAEFADGTMVRARILIGADGANSRVRSIVADVSATRTEITYVQTKVGRAELAEELQELDRMRHWSYWLNDVDAVNILMTPVRAGSQAEFDIGLHTTDHIADRTQDVSLESVLERIPADFDPRVIDGIRKTVLEPFAWPLFDLTELDRWTTGRVALIGDAAHAMRPTLGQGANQSIQDVEELVRSLEGVADADVPTALKKYESIRKPYVTAIQTAAREIEIKPDSWETLVDDENNFTKDHV